KEITYNLLLSINGTATDYPADPELATLINVKRSEQVNLSVIVLDAEDNTPAPDVLVEFYDYTNGDVLIGTDISGFNGNASILYTIDKAHKSGPTLVYARVGGVRNYSYYIVNESIEINIISGPNPLQINIYQTTSDSFIINGNVTDNKGNPVGYTEIKLRLFNKDRIDYTDYLIPYESNPYLTGNDGSFSLSFEVDPSNVPAGNYSLRLDFNGSFILTYDLNNDYSYDFTGVDSIDYLSNSSIFEKQLKIFDPDDIIIFLEVDNDPTPNPNDYDESYKPKSYIREIGQVSFQIAINQSGSAVESGYVTILDYYSNRTLYNYSYTGFESPKGFVQINIPTNKFYHAGIHKIVVRYMDFAPTNITYIVINETVNINVIKTIQPTYINNIVVRDVDGFIVKGSVKENKTGLRGLRVRLLLLNKNKENFSHYLIGDPFAITDEDGNFAIIINKINISCPQGEYYIRIDFNGSIEISETPGINLIRNYMISNSSLPVSINITADTYFINHYYYKDFPLPGWWENDTCHIVGYLRWDNNTGIVGVRVNATVKNGALQTIAVNSSLTIAQGYFEITLTITKAWKNPTIYISFYHPIDTIGPPDAYYIEEIIEIQVPAQ
ncbi:MAG: hypothetical protein ACFE9T_16410, partial [Promethearchaeota archaeon]